MRPKFQYLIYASCLGLVAIGVIYRFTNSRTHIHREAFRHIRVGISTKAEVRELLGPPNEPAWDHSVDGFYDTCPESQPGWHAQTWFGYDDCIEVTFDEAGIVRARRGGDMRKRWLSAPIRE